MANNNRGIPDAAFQLITEIVMMNGDQEVTVDSLLGPGRGRALTAPRHLCFYELYEMRRPNGERRFTLTMIGKWFSRDHTSVLHGVKKLKAQMEQGVCREAAE
jgi:chromosomal replication initiation ATPase DnaA